jgi:hypothetical protein
VNVLQTKFGECLLPCNAVQNLLSSRLLSRNVKIKIYKTIVLYGCETLSLTLREEHRLRVLGCSRTGCLGEYLDLRGMK